MAAELSPDDVRKLWQDQPVEVRKMSIDEIRRKAQKFERKIRKMYRAMYAVSTIVVVSYAAFFFLFPRPVARIGCLLTVVGNLCGAYLVHKRGPARRVPADPDSATCAVYRAELERQRDFHHSVLARMVAFVPGPVVFIMGLAARDLTPGQGIALGTALVLAPFLAAVPLNRRWARGLQREIDAVEACQRQA